MDYRALAELVLFGFLGLSVFIAVAGFTARLFFGPMIKDLISAYRERGRLEAKTAEVERMEVRLMEMEDELRRLRSGVDFDRELESGLDP